MVKRKQLDPSLSLIYTRHFPYNGSSRGGKKVLLGVGGNIGDVLRRFEHLFWYFERSGFIHIIETAPILKNPPFGFLEQDDFYNSLIMVETKLMPKALLRYIQRVESVFGRKRSFQDAPRTLDIDIIFYEDVSMQSDTLTLPHSGWTKRISVLLPLSLMKNRI